MEAMTKHWSHSVRILTQAVQVIRADGVQCSELIPSSILI
jgi:hypothetical protein